MLLETLHHFRSIASVISAPSINRALKRDGITQPEPILPPKGWTTHTSQGIQMWKDHILFYVNHLWVTMVIFTWYLLLVHHFLLWASPSSANATPSPWYKGPSGSRSCRHRKLGKHHPGTASAKQSEPKSESVTSWRFWFWRLFIHFNPFHVCDSFSEVEPWSPGSEIHPYCNQKLHHGRSLKGDEEACGARISLSKRKPAVFCTFVATQVQHLPSSQGLMNQLRKQIQTTSNNSVVLYQEPLLNREAPVPLVPPVGQHDPATGCRCVGTRGG